MEAQQNLEKVFEQIALVGQHLRAGRPDDALTELNTATELTKALPDKGREFFTGVIDAFRHQTEGAKATMRGDNELALGHLKQARSRLHSVRDKFPDLAELLEAPIRQTDLALEMQIETMDKWIAQKKGGELGARVRAGVERLSEVKPGEIAKVGAGVFDLTFGYYDSVLNQAKQSFRWALVAAGVGLAFFIGAVLFLLFDQSRDIATVTVIAGTLVEVISGINFVLYGKTTAQLAHFHEPLDRMQRLLLANAISETLAEEAKDKTRSQLVRIVASGRDAGSESE